MGGLLMDLGLGSVGRAGSKEPKNFQNYIVRAIATPVEWVDK